MKRPGNAPGLLSMFVRTREFLRQPTDDQRTDKSECHTNHEHVERTCQSHDLASSSN